MARRPTRVLAALLLAAGTLAAQDLRLVRVPVASAAAVDSLSRLGFEVADLTVTTTGTLEAVIVVSAETEARLGAAGFRAAPLTTPRAPVAYTVYRDFDDPATGLRATLLGLAATKPNVFVDSIGASIEGRPILAVKIGLAGDDPARPNVLYLATHHAREWISTEVAMALIGYLADSLAATSDSALLRTRDIWVIPVVNPDGYQFTFTAGGRLWRKNRRLNSDGSVGVDLNRNYPAFWGFDDRGSSPVGATEIFRGAGPGSEPEVQVVMAFHAAHPPRLSVSYHSYSDLVLHPRSFQDGRFAPDHAIFRALAGTAFAPAILDHLPGAQQTSYFGGPSWQLYTANGEYTDWAYWARGTVAFTVELTSGCCVGGAYYGFEFPDDAAMVAQVVRDNLPFALAVLRAAANPAGVAGVTPPRLETAWPQAWVDVTGFVPPTITVRPVTGVVGSSPFQQDSLDLGVTRQRAHAWAPSFLVAPRGVRVEGLAWEAEALVFGGAEDGETGWTGWTRTRDPMVGAYSWTTYQTDTLTSPPVDLTGRGAIWLQFWTRHGGSLFVPAWRGSVQFSADSGRTWEEVTAVAGSAPVWYPVRVDLPQATGARGAQVRFIGAGFPWWVDAAGLMTDQTTLFSELAAGSDLGVSQNPARGGVVVISWPPGTTESRLSIYTFRGERIHVATVPIGVGEYDWNLSVNGQPVANGGYIVVVESGAQRYRRRLFVARR